jgi:exoribonuclease-2
METAYDQLKEIAYKAMQEKGLQPEFPQKVLAEVEALKTPADCKGPSIRDMKQLLWCSIDNDDSLDLDQLTYAEKLPSGEFQAYIAVADVDALVKKSSAIDLHAQVNTTSVYTSACIFPLLPEKLSTNLTSLNENEDRLAMVFSILFNQNMEVTKSEIFHACVYNYAKLAYSTVGPWLEGTAAAPPKVSVVKGLEETLKLQDALAQALKKQRQAAGALSFETIETRPLFSNGKVVDLKRQVQNRANQLIESFMIAANTASARFSDKNKIPSLRRVVRVPERWDRIVEVAKGNDFSLPQEPDSKALDQFLIEMKKNHPDTYPDLSLTIIKLLGSGEYDVELPGEQPLGHFGLALRDYTHSTAPNRRYPDLLTQRLLKAVLHQEQLPYRTVDLTALAKQCTQAEDAAAKVERQVRKSAAAMLLKDRIGEQFQALVTGASDKGTWVRLESPLIEGKLVSGSKGLDVGDRVQVQLVAIDIDRGFIDFVRVSSNKS